MALIYILMHVSLDPRIRKGSAQDRFDLRREEDLAEAAVEESNASL